MKRLTSLELSHCTQLVDLEPLKQLINLEGLDLHECRQLSDVRLLDCFPKLEYLNISCTNITSGSSVRNLVLKTHSKLHSLAVYGTPFQDLHPAVCGSGNYENSIESVRQYYQELGKDANPDAEIKFFILGNGRAGKSCLVQRLIGKTFTEIEEIRLISTHGIQIETVTVPKNWGLPHSVRLCVWDFGGQDIYHGTHALFLREPAIYVLLFSKQTENDDSVPGGGFEMQNRRSPYWFDYLRQEAGSGGVFNSPVLLVQSRDDEAPKWEGLNATLPTDKFPNLSRIIRVSSKDPLGLEDFTHELKKAIRKLLHSHPQPPLPVSWAKVREEIRLLQKKKKKLTMSHEEFNKLCRKHKCESSAEVLCYALHQMGVVFYRAGLFANSIIIDQEWVLKKIYTIFDRTKELFQKRIRLQNGKFCRTDLQEFFWENEPIPDQRLYLSYMEQCGICFRADREQRFSPDCDGAYIAPDLLPKWQDGPEQPYAGVLAKPEVGVTATYTLLHDGISRGFLSKIGSVVGDDAKYWRYGCWFRDSTTSEVLIRAIDNTIRMVARDGEAAKLLQTLVEVLEQVPCGQPPVIEWDDRSPAAATLGRSPDSKPEERLSPELRPKLERLGTSVYTNTNQLIKFYFIGLALRSKPQGFRTIAKKFTSGIAAQQLPEFLPESEGGLRTLLKTIARNIFAPHFEVEASQLILYTKAKDEPNSDSKLTENGDRAWEDTRWYLERHGLLKPHWQL